jgi:predicted short-subunit dehydrogenase-like oxidoreductase (DUF2520 family)
VSIEAPATSLRFAVIGAGRLGASLALALSRCGQTLVGFTAGSEAGCTRAEGWLGVAASNSISSLTRLRPNIYFICVPDSAVAAVAADLARELRAAQGKSRPTAGSGDRAYDPDPVDLGVTAAPHPLVVAHTSGATSVSMLHPCEEAGAAALVFHPLQTFSEPLAGSTRFAGAGVAITPGPAQPDAAGTTGMQVAGMLSMRPFFLADDKRGLYHAAASVACNYFVTLEYVAEQLFVKAGLPERATLSLFLPLVEATLANLAARGPADALTGPLSRGDTITIAEHLAALAADAPETLPVYRSLGLATLDLVAARHEVPAEELAALRGLLTGPT